MVNPCSAQVWTLPAKLWLSLLVQKTKLKHLFKQAAPTNSRPALCCAQCTTLVITITMAKSKSPAKKLRSLRRLITFRKKYRVQYLDFKPTKSNLSVCIQTSISIEPLMCDVQQESIKRQSQPFTLSDFLSLAEVSRQEDDRQRKKEREEREKEREKDLRSLNSMLNLPPF